MEHQAQSFQSALPASLTPIQLPGYLRLGKIVSYVIRIWVTIGIFSLIMRIFLLLTAANPETPFVRFVYNISADYMRPFLGIFPSRGTGTDAYFDVSAAFAIIVYLFLMWGISELISYIDYRARLFKASKRAELEALESQEKQGQVQDDRPITTVRAAEIKRSKPSGPQA